MYALDATRMLTLQEAADALEVHYMTAYRYVRLGLLEADKVSGSWQVREEAITSFRNGRGPGPVEPGSHAPWAQRLESRLVSGDAQGAWNVVEASMVAGGDPRSVYLDVLAPAMVSIGERWAVGDVDVAEEHRASVIAMRIVGRLGPRFARRGRPCGEIVVGAVAGEFHALASAVLSDLMRAHGWEVTDLGADVPMSSFLHALREVVGVKGVGISATETDRLTAVSECCSAIKRDFPDLLVVVGGRAFENEDHARSLGADALAADADQFHRLLQTS